MPQKKKYPKSGGPAIGIGPPSKRVLEVAKQLDKAQGGITNTPAPKRKKTTTKKKRSY